jgi:hypothetical protein
MVSEPAMTSELLHMLAMAMMLYKMRLAMTLCEVFTPAVT